MAGQNSGEGCVPGAGTSTMVVGEIFTCLLPNSTALDRPTAEELLTVIPGQLIGWRERPSSLADSVSKAVGFDCYLETASGAGIKSIGTAAVSGSVSGGRILQSSARTGLVQAAAPRRKRWAHYLDRVGVMETLSPLTPQLIDNLIAGFLLPGDAHPRALDLASMSKRMLGELSMGRCLDRRIPFKANMTQLRWAARVGDVASPQLSFRLGDTLLRTVLVTVADPADLPFVSRFCSELARHDWMLTVAAATTTNETDVADTIAPLLSTLTHLWSPGAHTPEMLRPLWQQLEHDPGFSEEWHAKIGHLRDRVNAATLFALHRTRGAGPE